MSSNDLTNDYAKVFFDRDDATLRFMMVAAVFYGLSTFEGSFMAIRSVNAGSRSRPAGGWARPWKRFQVRMRRVCVISVEAGHGPSS